MTVEKIAWIVGVELGSMFESEADWAKKIKGKARIRRIYKARSLVCLALHELCNVSYGEISQVVGKRHQSVIGRSIQQGRLWREENKENLATWDRIEKAVLETIAAEKAAHAKDNNIKVGLSA